MKGPDRPRIYNVRMTWFLLLLLIAGAAYAWFRFSSKPKMVPYTPPQDEKEKLQYHAVSIKFYPSACQAAKQLEDKRFLSAEAPDIPLPDCDAEVCKCRYIHFDDRRSGEDRRDQYRPASAEPDPDDERHRHADRRRSHLYS